MSRSIIAAAAFGALWACGRSQPVEELPGVVRVSDPNVVVDPTIQQGAPPGCYVTAVEKHTLAPMRRRPIDVLLVIDDSPSMADDQQLLAQNFNAFFGSFQRDQIDFHIGAITTDMRSSSRSGRLVGPYLSNTTPDVADAFRGMVRQGTRGSAVEQALGAVWAATREPLLSRENAGFIRREADLAIIFVGDEDDQSSVGLKTLADSLRALKGEGPAITVVSIIGLSSGWTCFSALLTGWRLAQFARLFGDTGMVAVCRDDWADLLRSVAGRIVASRCIVGLQRPLDDRRRIHITVNGTPASWVTHRPDEKYPSGSIEVEPCPEGGGVVTVAYDDCP